MNRILNILSISSSVLLQISYSQAAIIGFEAENGEYESITQPSAEPIKNGFWTARVGSGNTSLIPSLTDFNGFRPQAAEQVVTYTVNFSETGKYNLWARIAVEPSLGDSADSLFVAREFGNTNFESPGMTTGQAWSRANNLDNLTPDFDFFDIGDGFRWVNISKGDGARVRDDGTGQPGSGTDGSGQDIRFEWDYIVSEIDVTNGNTKFEIASRENNIAIDAFAFATSDETLSAAILDASIVQIPEPSSVLMIGLGSILVLSRRRR